MCMWSKKPIAVHKVPENEPMIAYKVLVKDNRYRSNYRFELIYKSPYQYTYWNDNEHHVEGTLNKTCFGRTPGIFCFKSLQAARKWGSKENFYSGVIVKLEIWGTVYEHGKEEALGGLSIIPGYRAKHARIVKDYPIETRLSLD